MPTHPQEQRPSTSSSTYVASDPLVGNPSQGRDSIVRARQQPPPDGSLRSPWYRSASSSFTRALRNLYTWLTEVLIFAHSLSVRSNIHTETLRGALQHVGAEGSSRAGLKRDLLGGRHRRRRKHPDADLLNGPTTSRSLRIYRRSNSAREYHTASPCRNAGTWGGRIRKRRRRPATAA